MIFALMTTLHFVLYSTLDKILLRVITVTLVIVNTSEKNTVGSMYQVRRRVQIKNTSYLKSPTRACCVHEQARAADAP